MIGENLLGPEPTLLDADAAILEELAAGGDPQRMAREHPESPAAWAALADQARTQGRDLDAYAYARVGYHRGLDQLRKAGWRGAGPVPWAHPGNRGVLHALFALRRGAQDIGEIDEADRLTAFLEDADSSVIAILSARS